MASKPILTIRPRRPAPVLLCSKCVARSGGNFRRRIKHALKRQPAAPGSKRPRLVMTSCFGICPKRAVVLASGLSLRKGEYVVLSDPKAAGEAVGLLVAGAATVDRKR